MFTVVSWSSQASMSSLAQTQNLTLPRLNADGSHASRLLLPLTRQHGSIAAFEHVQIAIAGDT